MLGASEENLGSHGDHHGAKAGAAFSVTKGPGNTGW